MTPPELLWLAGLLNGIAGGIPIGFILAFLLRPRFARTGHERS